MQKTQFITMPEKLHYFLCGIASVFSMGRGVRLFDEEEEQYDVRAELDKIYPYKTSSEAFQADWQKIGGDFRKVMGDYERNRQNQQR